MSNIPADTANQARSTIDQSKDLLILLPHKPSFDAVASGLSLYLALSSQGKNITIVCPDQMTVEFNRLIGVDKIGNGITSGSGRNLVISFPYQEGSIEKVSYNIENDLFNLVIEPREGYPVITPEMMQYSFSGGGTDAIICIGAESLNHLDPLYSANVGLFADKPVLNIDNSSQNQGFGKINIVDSQSSSISEIIVSLFSLLGLSMNEDIASNVYSGIASGTQNFTSSTTNASTFEAAAICLRNGANKQNNPAKFVQNQQPVNQPAVNQFAKPPPRQPFNQPRNPQQFQPKPPYQQPRQQQHPVAKPQYQQPQSARPVQTANQPQQHHTPVQQQNQQQSPAQPQQQKQHDDAPPDWLKPKIYKGSTLL